MKLLNLNARNIFSLGDVTLNLEDRGLTLITGWSYDDNNGNAAGKSSLASSAPIWCLYGKTVDGIRADSVINTSVSNAKHCSATIYFVGIDGQTYRVYRSRKPNELVLSLNVSDVKDETLEEWQDLSQRNEKDTQELIDKLLGRDHKTFIQSDFFGQGRERSFLSLAGSEQRSVIEEILPLTSLEKWHKSAKEHSIKAQEIVDEGRMMLNIMNQKITTLLSKLKDIEAQHTQWYTDNITTISMQQTKLNQIRQSNSTLCAELHALSPSLPTNAPVEELLNREQSIRQSIELDVNTLLFKIGALENLIKDHTSRPNICPTCYRPFSLEQLESNTKIVLDKEKELERLARAKGEKEAILYNSKVLIGIYKRALEITTNINLKLEETSLLSHIKESQERRNPFDTLMISTAQELSQEEDLAKLHKMILVRDTEVLTHFKFWDNAFGKDLKTLLFNQVCPYLESKTNQYLRDLDNGQIKVRFSTEKKMKSGDTKDEFCVTASSNTGSSVFELFSGAEKQLTSFAVGMALSDLASLQAEGASQFMILDEPFLYQSPENCERIINYITHKLSDKKSTILLISNEDNLKNLVPNRVHVVKKNGVSSIE